MNLIDLITRKDRNLVRVGHDLEIIRLEWESSWRAIRIQRDETAQLVLGNIESHYFMRSRPSDIGWFAAISGLSGSGELVVSIQQGRIKRTNIVALTAIPVPVFLPWPDNSDSIIGDVRISFHFILKHGECANILIHQRLERSHILRYAVGNGVELGPGPKPQVLPSDSVKVEYVEESPMEKWVESYDQNGKYGAKSADFSNYTIGTAWDLPQYDNSLDFIFSSHVIEHLANPIGHFVRWKQKLKLNGAILAVVPDMLGTKDYLATPSTIDELEEEFRAGISAPSKRHYARWATMKKKGREVDDLIAKGVSIHAHFYNPNSMADLLGRCVNDHGFNHYSIIQRRNHKDFYFILK